ncbi:MAG: hypothetical protein AAFN94_11900 [Pseudomonadota bacterium]
MKRICVIGNSHLAALKQAIDTGAIDGVSDSYSFDTFGAVRANLRDVEVVGTQVTAKRKLVRQSFLRTGGRKTIDLSHYNGVVLAYRNSPFFIRAYLGKSQPAPISAAVIEAVIQGFFNDWSIKLAQHIARAMGDRPVWFLGRPFNAEHDHHARVLLGAVRACERTRERVVGISDQVTDMLGDSDLEPNLKFHRPPPSVLEPLGLFSRSEFVRGGKELAAGIKSDRASAQVQGEDTIHMNAAYGAAVLADILGSKEAAAV